MKKASIKTVRVAKHLSFTRETVLCIKLNMILLTQKKSCSYMVETEGNAQDFK